MRSFYYFVGNPKLRPLKIFAVVRVKNVSNMFSKTKLSMKDT